LERERWRELEREVQSEMESFAKRQCETERVESQ
jgi:hypothetical protein